MKNIFAVLFLALFVFNSADAQDVLKNKNGREILPVQGDIALGVNAVPVFNFLGNAFNGNTSNFNALSGKLFNNSTIVGKYMLTDKSAARVALGFNINSTTDKEFSFDDSSNDPNDLVEDTRTTNSGTYALNLGYEMRRGHGRVQGYFGGDIRFFYDDNSTSYTYGNGMGTTNVQPTATNWGGNLNNDSRVLSKTNQDEFFLGVRPFIGVEYFVAPQVALGTEFGWSLGYERTTQGVETTERFEVSTDEVLYDLNKTGVSNGFAAGTDNFDASVFLYFYF